MSECKEQNYQSRIAELEKQVSELQEIIKELRAQIEKLIKPPKNSGNSSIPGSKDENKKYYPKRESSGKAIGGQPGHLGSTRELFEKPDEIIELKPSKCPQCGSYELLEVKTEIRQVVEIPALKAKVTEYKGLTCECTDCKVQIKAEFPKEAQTRIQLGSQMKGLIGYLKVQNNLSHEKISQTIENIYGIRLSEGAIDGNLSSLKEELEGEYKQIINELQNAEIVHSDETRNRVNGRNKYSWAFLNDGWTFIKSQYSRAYSVIEDLFKAKYPKVWISDRYNAQLKVPSKHQICLAHVIRDLKYVEEADKSKWARGLRELIQLSIHERNEGLLKGKKNEMKEKFKESFAIPPPEGKEERRLFGSLSKLQSELMYFLDHPEIEPTNNAAEQTLRKVVIHRKMNGGFRSDGGLERYDVLVSIIESAKKQGKNILDVLSRLDFLSFSYSC